MRRGNAALVHALASTRNTRREPATLVISRWLNRCQAGQWTPFEAAEAIEQELRRAGYKIVAADKA